MVRPLFPFSGRQAACPAKHKYCRGGCTRGCGTGLRREATSTVQGINIAYGRKKQAPGKKIPTPESAIFAVMKLKPGNISARLSRLPMVKALIPLIAGIVFFDSFEADAEVCLLYTSPSPRD